MVDERVIIEQNPWWMSRENIRGDEKVKEAFKRKNKLLYNFREKKNILFFGPRQTGKTTLFKLLIYDLIINKRVDARKILYFSCEILRKFEDIVDVVRRSDELLEGEKYIFLDEISFVDEWERAVKYILDSPLKRNKVIYITGSSSITLKKESFPGRPIEIREFLPLTFRSFIKIFGSKKLKENLNTIIDFRSSREVYEKCKKIIYFKEEIDRLLYKYMQSGGFPRAFYELMEEGKIREETYDVYWRWLVHDLAKLNRSEKIASGVLIGILKNYTTKFSLSSIAKEVEIGSHVTVREYLEILESLYCIRNIYTFDINKKRIVYRKMRKAYFIDPFLIHTFSKMLLGRRVEDYSKIVEGIIMEALARRFGKNLGFYHNRKEVDACFNNFGVEVKYKGGVTFKDFPKINVKNKVLVSRNELNFDEERNIAIVPASLLLSLI
ncbi:MAG: ATP-binding protein [archaeon GB-1867-097]|nr:ATP-binding protein [Candidatus Culexmicrobium thermophilum]